MVRRVFYVSLLFLCSCQSRSQDYQKAGLSDEKEVVCFVYHRFNDSRYPSTNTSTWDFEAHLKYLLHEKFQVLTFSDAIDYLKSERKSVKTAVITIDDAYESFFEYGLPLLRKYQMPATLFVNTKTVGGGDYMSWEELQKALENQIEIGNHTHSHQYFLNDRSPGRYDVFRKEIAFSQAVFKEQLHVTPVVFSYPYGEFDSAMKKVVQNFGFKAAAAQNSGVVHAGGDLFTCPRFPMSEAYAAIGKFKEKALTRALRVVNSIPNDFLLAEDKRPQLTLMFDKGDLQLKRLQCFVQGGSCKFQLKEGDSARVTLYLQAEKNLSRRRTLYTITIPDKTGTWHWYSHLWIDPSR